MTPEKRASAVTSMRSDGFVILEEVVDPSHLDLLRGAMLEDVSRILAREGVPFNFNSGNIQQQPPISPKFLFRDILVNDMVADVVAAVLGPLVMNSAYTGNTCLPGKQRQPVHFDSGDRGDAEGPGEPVSLVVNIPVVDMDAQNGSTEIWPGTHVLSYQFRSQGDDIKLPESALEERRKSVPPLQPRVKAGSVLIRDMRLWHAGMPNHTDTPRPMIALIPRRGVVREPLVVQRGVEEKFDHPVFRWCVSFVEETPDHIRHGEAYY